jgi:hypothetical protein
MRGHPPLERRYATAPALTDSARSSQLRLISLFMKFSRQRVQPKHVSIESDRNVLRILRFGAHLIRKVVPLFGMRFSAPYR